MWRRWVLIVAGLLMFVTTATSPAQDAATQEGAEETPKTPSATATADTNQSESPAVTPPQIREKAGRIQYVGPDTYILLDAQGRPQPVPGMTYEDFLEAWKKSQQTTKPDATARYVLESIELEGVTRDGFAELDFVATVRLLVDGPVQVPLGLVGAILQGEAKFDSANANATPKNDGAVNGAGDLRVAEKDYVTQNPDEGGIVAHLAGRADERRRVSLKLIVPLSRDGAETTLPLSCPRAVSSNLTLTTSTPVTDASVNSGTLVEHDPVKEGGTRLQVVGGVGPIRLTWHSAEKAATEYATVLSASGTIRVSVDGRSVRSDARLRVQSYGGGFDRFRVRLPPGAQFIPEPTVDAEIENPKYRVSVEDGENGAGGGAKPGAAQVVLVEFPEKQFAPVTIDLSTEQPIGLEGQGSAVELAGFEVLGAVRQFGDVALHVADDWQARWQIGDHLRQVDPDELEASLQQPNPTAAFQYDRRAWSLGVRVEPRQTRIHVTPQYDVQCLPDEARLTLRLNYQVYGARAFEFRIRMEGWSITGSPLASGGLVDLDKILRAPDGTLTLPLAQASTPRAEIVLSLRHPIPRDQQRLELPLPVPEDATIGTGDLTVRATPDVELQFDSQNSVGLAAAATPNAADPQTGTGTGLHFRTVLPNAVLVANRLSRAQQISAEAVALVEISAGGASVDQQLNYDVQHVPVKELIFEAPHELWIEEDQIKVALVTTTLNDTTTGQGETPLVIAPAAEDLEATNSGVSTRFRVPLPQPRLGQFTVHVRYRVARPNAANTNVTWPLPLVRPTGTQGTDLRARIHAPRGWTIALDANADDSTWRPAATDSEIERPGSVRSYVARAAETVLPLTVTASNFNPSSATMVDRIWLQTWFSGGVRQDRAAIRFRTAGSEATVELPEPSPQSSAVEIEVLLDGEPAEVLSRDEARIVVRVGRSAADNGELDEAKPAEHTLELRSRQPVNGGLLTRHRLSPPLLVGGRALAQVYWQIVLPGDEHVVRSPERMSSASRWQWVGSFLGQRPVMSQTELEKWAGASEQQGPAAAQNEYLYAGLASVLSIDFITAPRWLIVLFASSVVLAIALIWINVPVARQSWIVAAAASIIAGLAVAFPIPAVLLAQAAAIGVVVALLALLLRRATSRPSHWPVTVSGGSSQRQVSPRSDSILAPPMSAASTAPTVPLRISDSHQ
jgi:hypothetical protein